MKIFKCYLKNYPKWQYYDLTVIKQRALILKVIKEIYHWDEKYIEEVMPYERIRESSGVDEANLYGEIIEPQIIDNDKWEDFFKGRHIDHETIWIRKQRKDYSDEMTLAKIVWYFDTKLSSREGLQELFDSLHNGEDFYSADFTADYLKHEDEGNEPSIVGEEDEEGNEPVVLWRYGKSGDEPYVLCMESTKEAIFYQTIFQLIRNKKSLREIQIAISTGDMTISHVQIGTLGKSACLDVSN